MASAMSLKPLLRRLVVGALMILISLPVWCLEAPEYKIKATFLYNFAKFTDWPNGTSEARDPVYICVVGQNPFDSDLDELVTGKSVESRPLQIRHLTAFDKLEPCHIL